MPTERLNKHPRGLCAIVVVTVATLISQQRETLALNPVLDLNGTYPYLINRTSGQLIEPRDYMDFDNLYAPSEAYKANQTIQGRTYHLLKAFDFANYFQSDYWHYTNQRDLELSAKPVANPDRCAQQLDWLEAKLNNTGSYYKRGQQHSNLMTYLDSFGRPESTTFYGHGYWLGSYHECIHTDLDMHQYEQEECSQSGSGAQKCGERLASSSNLHSSLKARYCIGKGRDIDWPSPEQDNYVPVISYKIGLCLPETCETLSIREHRAQLERLMRINMPDHLKARVNLYDLYCLPDSRSPIRALSLQARVFLALCGVWLLASIVATSLYSCYRKHQQDLRNIMLNEQEASVRLNHAADTTNCKEASIEVKPESQYMLNCKAADTNCDSGTKKLLANHTQLLFVQTQTALTVDLAPADVNGDTTIDIQRRNSSPSPSISSRSTAFSLYSRLNLSETKLMVRVLKALSIRENLIDFVLPPRLLRESGVSQKLPINLNALDCIKCLSCLLVIFGHVVFVNMQHLTNITHTMEYSRQSYPKLLIGLFNFVDTFFIISGMLTAYFVFKRFDKKTFGRPTVWLSFIIIRLLRLTPVYLFVFWFIKTLGVYLDDGPIWDYGTDKNSIKGLCINDSWWKSILYLGNIDTMQPLCVLPAWSIILDAQYSLIIPPALYLIFRHKRLGYLALAVTVVVTTAKMSFQLANQTAVKADDMGKARLHVYPLISRFATEFYNSVWNRVGPLAIGIVGGHMLHQYETGSIRVWPWFMRGAAFKFVLLLHALILILPSIGILLESPESTSNGETGITIFVFSNATIKPIWSIINTILLLRLITDLRTSSEVARLMSHNIWHCLGKLCFASYLIHFEVILYLLKSRQQGLSDLDWPYIFREFSFAFLISTIIAYLLYILYEAPINNLIMLVYAKPICVNKKNAEERKPFTEPNQTPTVNQV